MKAVTASSLPEQLLELREVSEPIADSNEALIQVTAFSLNRGELRRAQSAVEGARFGWDLVRIWLGFG